MREVAWKESLNSVLLLLLVNIASGFRLELMYISLIELSQVKPQSSPWFSAACAAAIVIEITFFRLYQNDKSSESKVKFTQASNRCKRVLKAAKLACANKTRVHHFQKFGSHDFWRIANGVLSKGKSAVPLLFSRLKVLSSASYKAKLFAENVPKNSNLGDNLHHNEP